MTAAQGFDGACAAPGRGVQNQASLQLQTLEALPLTDHVESVTNRLAHITHKLKTDVFTTVLEVAQWFNDGVTPDMPRAAFDKLMEVVPIANFGLTALEWIPRVTHEERMQFEARARRDLMRDIGISRRAEGDQGPLSRDIDRAEYFPIMHSHPQARTYGALLYNVGSDERRLESLIKCRDEGRPIISAGVMLVDPRVPGVILLHPKYKGHPRTVEERRQCLMGFSTLVLQVGDLVARHVERHGLGGLRLWVLDVTNSSRLELLYTPTGGPPPESGLIYTEQLRVGERVWRFVIVSWRPRADPESGLIYTEQQLSGGARAALRDRVLGGLL
eukprot:CAMPEP_0182909666 /NCGR_PEP_ID=MMETSP0034_2-20130328/35881_1 /TAXON_ID=156128 /ORGANISM="Nephroselmis pyriformis, Strain CCMP717" /LENGTH=330 /DNA_ID=CAMNT_0025045933 /DNA_START=1 /DNA_END=994 /DNA_ORIENTATION=+